MNRKRPQTGAHTFVYKRRSQVYAKLRTRKLESGNYLVQHEPSGREFYVFKRLDAEDWAVASRQHPPALRGGFRKKDDAMEALAKEGPKAIRAVG